MQMEQQQKSIWKMYSERNRWKSNNLLHNNLSCSLGGQFSKISLKIIALIFLIAKTNRERLIGNVSL